MNRCPEKASSRKITLNQKFVSVEMISAAARILEASDFCEIGPTSSEVLAQEMLLTALDAEYDRQENILIGK